jgi:hypothetical protein
MFYSANLPRPRLGLSSRRAYSHERSAQALNEKEERMYMSSFFQGLAMRD